VTGLSFSKERIKQVKEKPTLSHCCYLVQGKQEGDGVLKTACSVSKTSLKTQNTENNPYKMVPERYEKNSVKIVP
jgi:hypothetical protein